MVKIKFPDGAIRSYESGLTPYEIASSISSGLARSIISQISMVKKLKLQLKYLMMEI